MFAPDMLQIAQGMMLGLPRWASIASLLVDYLVVGDGDAVTVMVAHTQTEAIWETSQLKNKRGK